MYLSYKIMEIISINIFTTYIHTITKIMNFISEVLYENVQYYMSYT